MTCHHCIEPEPRFDETCHDCGEPVCEHCAAYIETEARWYSVGDGVYLCRRCKDKLDD